MWSSRRNPRCGWTMAGPRDFAFSLPSPFDWNWISRFSRDKAVGGSRITARYATETTGVAGRSSERSLSKNARYDGSHNSTTNGRRTLLHHRTGARFTGMPGFGEDPGNDRNEETWGLVHFIRHLPAITKDERAQTRRWARGWALSIVTASLFSSGSRSASAARHRKSVLWIIPNRILPTTCSSCGGGTNSCMKVSGLISASPLSTSAPIPRERSSSPREQ